MFLFDFFRSFLPMHNPWGFGASDFVEFALVALLVALVLLHGALQPLAARFAERTGWCMLLLFALPLVLRLALLPHFPIPTPGGADDYSYILLADTLRHFRLTNPVHPMHYFFETVFVLQQPTYSSIYSPGQGLLLALGWDLFGHPWAGVALAAGAFCALSYWMLRGWTTPEWSMVGGLLAVAEFGPLNEWMNIYWGGALCAAAGCLVFGALPRLRNEPNRRDAVLLGVGLAIHLLARPFEFLFLAIAAAAFLLPDWRRLAKFAPVAALAVAPAAALLLLHAHSVTGNWLTIPYMESRYQYGVPTTFTFQPAPVAHNDLTVQQRLTYEGQTEVHDTAGPYFDRWASRLRFYRFFLLAPLYLALPFFLLRLRERRFLWLAGTVLLFTLGTTFYPYFFPQYVAATACLLLLAAIAGLERLSRITPAGARVLLYLAGAHFLFYYGVHMLCNDRVYIAMRHFESWDYVNFGDPEGRLAIDRQLAAIPGKKLVFVRYSAQHEFHEWIHNAAEIDRAPVVMALDRMTQNDTLRKYYPDRSVWLLEPDARPVRLRPYKETDDSPFLDVR
ncbi:MAG TPA: hypothetical protein VHW09_12490 [Bryobacteraceae bacterium]|jgi:hypothetical protein|nr:hypothetical protein [Bryobacteraceae bacterium]